MDFKETNFQQASCALDAGAKIYASRVDNVHSNTLKVLGGLGRTDQGNDQDGENSSSLSEAELGVTVEDMDADDHDGDEPSKPRTRKVREGANVFETNLDNINMKSDSTAFSVDPMFHIMSAKFDEGGVLHCFRVPLRRRLTFCIRRPWAVDAQSSCFLGRGHLFRLSCQRRQRR